MYKIKVLLLLLFLGFQTLSAQNTGLSIDLNRPVENSPDWDLNLRFELSNGNSDLLILLPSNVTAVPATVTKNDQSLWLRKSPDLPQSENTVHWDKTDAGILLRFDSNSIQQNSVINILFKSRLDQPDSSRTIIIRRAEIAGDGRIISGDTIIENDIPEINSN